MKRNEIWAICSSRQGQISQCSLEVIGAAKKLQAQRPEYQCAAVLFDDENTAAFSGIDRVYALNGTGTEADAQGRGLAEAIGKFKPDIILAPGTVKDRSICSVAASLVGAGMTADCIEIGIHDGMLVSTRPALGGSVVADIICPEKRPQISTIRPGSFTPYEMAGTQPEIVTFQANQPFKGTELLECCPAGRDRICLTESRILFAGGLGLGSAAAFGKLEKIAGRLGAGVVASRGAVNAGYAPYSRQVGLSGMCVGPEVYIALGISGAAQHMAGIRRAKKIIAVNTDPKAPIFQFADIGIVADWEDYTEGLLKTLI